jgi:probable F420-dependent oxidoreductase
MAGVPPATLSIGIPNFGPWIGGDWRVLLDLARAADAAAVDRIMLCDHVLMGTRPEAYSWGRFPGAIDDPWLEPLSVIGALGAVTSSVRLATGILIAPLRPAPLLAKMAATLDVLCEGRLDLGVGVGWQAEEYWAQGLDFDTRGSLLDDTVGGCRALWEALPASFSSEHVSFDNVYCAPQPVQARLPVWFGGTLNTRNLRRIRELGDGWLPIMGATHEDICDGARRLQEATDRDINVQAPLRAIRRDDGSRDPVATMDVAPDLIAAGVNDVYVNIVSFARSPDHAPDALAELAAAFRQATS